MQADEKGNSDMAADAEVSSASLADATIAFLEYLRAQDPERRIALIWDGTSYHRSQDVKAYLAAINQDLNQSNWKITCIRFAPNAPEQNPIEVVWLQVKRFIREYYHLGKYERSRQAVV